MTGVESQDNRVTTPISDINPWLDDSVSSSASTSHSASPNSNVGNITAGPKVSRISSISSVTSSTSSTGSNGPTTAVTGDELKPIRLMKRQQERRKSQTLPTPLVGISSPSTSVVSFGRSLLGHSAKSPVTEEFQCRPIRLGSNGRRPGEKTPVRSTFGFSVDRDNSDRISEKNDRERSDRKYSAPDLSGHLTSFHANGSSASVGSLGNISVNSSHTILSKQSAKRKSIQIKKLPQPSEIPHYLNNDDMVFAMCLVDFHHQRGPEVQWWKSNYHPDYNEHLFQNLPFQALPDGSHLFEETFSNFNLVYDFKLKLSIDDLKDLNNFKGDPRDLKTLFGCSCVRQVKTSDLSQDERDRNQDITRSIVQKALVIISRKQPIFTKIKEKLSIITKSYFQQEDLQDFEVLENLFENLNSTFKMDETVPPVTSTVLDLEIENFKENEQEDEYFVNLNLKQSILKFKHDFLLIFKCLLLHKKVIIFSNTNLEMLTQFQNNLISLFPSLINNLDNSGCPLLDYIETNGPLEKPSSLNTTNRKSMLRFFGLPLQIFNTKNSFWNPYLPLQQLDELTVESFMIGCSNLLFLNQAENYHVDLIVNLDTGELTYPCGKADELTLSHSDKKFINNLIHNMNDGGKDEFVGNDDFIRYQFEDYLTSLVSTMRFAQYVENFKQPPPGFDPQSSVVAAVANTPHHSNSTLPYGVGDLSLFNKKFVESWKLTNNFKIWNAMADEFMFNFIEPKHLGVNISETSQAYKNISSFFNSFKFKGEEPEESKAQKFLPEDDTSSTTTKDSAKDTPKSLSDEDTLGEEFEHVHKEEAVSKLATWASGWGFKRK